MMKMPRVWEILKEFKASCAGRGWKTSESEDWILVDGKYHNFLWARGVHPSSFNKIISNGKCIVREDLSYRVVKASYTAWLFSEAPPETLTKAIFNNPGFSDKVAIYDLSPMLEGKSLCLRLNHTDSPVFQEFEDFLKNQLKVKLKSVSSVSTSVAKVKPGNFRIPELA
jgi:hypothetical protein